MAWFIRLYFFAAYTLCTAAKGIFLHTCAFSQGFARVAKAWLKSVCGRVKSLYDSSLLAAPLQRGVPKERGSALENLFCLRCNRELEPGGKSVAVYLFAQTVGVRP